MSAPGANAVNARAGFLTDIESHDVPFRIFLFGQFRIEHADRALTEPDWRRQHPKRLLQLLAAAPRRTLTRDEVVEALWPDAQPHAAYNRLYHTAMMLRRTLGGSSDSDVVLIANQQIALAGSRQVWVDASAFESLVDAADAGHGAEAIALLEQAIRLYRGPLLPGVDELDGLAQRRRELDRLYIDALKALACAYREDGQHDRLLATLERWIAASPTDEEAHRCLIEMHLEQGRLHAASAQHQQLRAILAAELGVRPSPEIEHMIARQRERMIGVAPAGESRAAAEPCSHVANRLPRLMTSFVGRADLLARLVALIEPGCPGIVTLLGAGGAGKTRLAIEVPQRVQRRFAHGLLWLDLARAHHAGDVEHIVAEALGTNGDDNRSSFDALARFLDSRQVLVIIDNAEHALDEVRRIVALLPRTSEVICMVTSRRRLAVREELVIEVPPLDVPDAASQDGDALREAGAVAMFAARARDVRPRFAPDSEQLRTIARICGKLDGLPLAIELAAAKMHSWTPEEILQRLTHSLSHLDAAWADLDPHQRSLDASFAWSAALVSDDARKLLYRLTVFVGSFTRDAVLSVCADGELPSERIDGAVDELVEHSLLVRSMPRQGGSATRFKLPETVRSLARGRLLAPMPFVTRYVTYYASFAERYAVDLTPSHRPAAVALLTPELANFEAVLEHCAQLGDWKSYVRVVASIAPCWLAQGDRARARHVVETALRHVDKAALHTRMRLTYCLGLMCHTRVDSQRKCLLMQEAADLSAQLGDRLHEDLALASWSQEAARGRQPRVALRWFEARLAERHGLAASPAFPYRLCGQAALLGQAGEIVEAQMMVGRAVRMHRHVREDSGLAMALLTSVDLALSCADFMSAHDALQEAREVVTHVETADLLAQVLYAHAALAMREGRLDTALVAAREAQEYIQHHGVVDSCTSVMDLQAQILNHDDKYLDALALSESLLAGHDTADIADMPLARLRNLAWSYAYIGRIVEAQALIAAALNETAAIGHVLARTDTLEAALVVAACGGRHALVLRIASTLREITSSYPVGAHGPFCRRSRQLVLQARSHCASDLASQGDRVGIDAESRFRMLASEFEGATADDERSRLIA